ncbi:RidA family protein [Noviherbaspirillum cavernae]|uniref:RidA family protein n=1 Tax=Noviherbaspirillum cavernae TaxID=2320862 RepID=A0A418WXU3_9BURK|nr:RidA family protein [Noviherbaspirillum cavernae]RJG05017.1 RidA family protein [Noviherbaspirillum cavernae]
MTDIQRSHVGKRLSEIAEYNGVIYLAGQIADDVEQDMRGQTAQVLACVDRLLAEKGSDKSRILQCQIYISDMSLFSQMNEVWDAWVAPGNTPPRATVQAQLASPKKLIEVVVTAASAPRKTA